MNPTCLGKMYDMRSSYYAPGDNLKFCEECPCSPECGKLSTVTPEPFHIYFDDIFCMPVLDVGRWADLVRELAFTSPCEIIDRAGRSLLAGHMPECQIVVRTETKMVMLRFQRRGTGIAPGIEKESPK